MKIVSWNINGIRSAWNHGLSAFLDERKNIYAHDRSHDSTRTSELKYRGPADIYAFQETRCNEPFLQAELNGYYPFWSFCEEKKGYSGTLCLTKWKPFAVSYDMTVPGEEKAEDDIFELQVEIEGRIITLDFGSFYFVNCYYPNSQHGRKRFDYRYNWDKAFVPYLTKLKSKKPTIVCGDFNVAISNDDIYPENKAVENGDEGFQATERENLLKLIDAGYCDSYREKHPEEIGVYSWWSNRRNKREENKGWRLDYALVSNKIAAEINESTLLTNVQGSDHCPLFLDIDISTASLTKKSRNPGNKVDYSDVAEISKLSFIQQDEFLSRIGRNHFESFWNSIDWKTAEQNLKVMQEALAKSAYTKSPKLIKKWQDRIFNSLDAKLLAVRHVSSANGLAGVDKVKWTTSHEKMSAALALVVEDYHARPSRLVVIKGKNGKTRRIHIETYQDRAMQCLCAMALDPVAESWGDKKSFAFRKGRSSFDLNEYIRLTFSAADLVPPIEFWNSGAMASGGDNPPEWAFIGDVTQCYENISHDWIVNNIPLPKTILKEFLQAGYFFAGELFPMDSGVGIGLSLSPIIANMALDGLQEHIYNSLYGEDTRPVAYIDKSGLHITPKKRPIDYSNGNLTRYADDIVVSARSKEEAEKIQDIVKSFLKLRGLELSETKSKIINIYDGFTFMSRLYIKRDGYIYVYPSDESVERFKSDIQETIMNHVGSQQSLIDKLNRKIVGWTTYHKVEDSTDVFKQLDVYIKALLLDLCERKHPKWNRSKIFEKYWFKRSDGIMCYALSTNKSIRVRFLQDSLIIKHNQVKLSMNPYADSEYVDWRADEREAHNTTGMYRSIWERQEGKCFYCGKPMLIDQEKQLVDVDPSSRKKVGQFAYVHACCMEGSVEYINDEDLPSTAEDLADILERLSNNDRDYKRKYTPLSEYFRTNQNTTIKLKFNEIDSIIGRKLGKSATTQLSFWYRTGFGTISESWLDNGYEIKKLDIEHKTVTFHLVEKGTTPLEIPSAFTNSRIPEDAKYELENFFKYIEKKYGL